MMKRKGHKHALTMLLSLCATVGAAHADMDVLDGKATVSGEINAGVQQKIVDGASGKFEEYRDVRNGFLINDLRVKVDGNTTPYFLDIKIKNPVQDNESYDVDGGVHGRYSFGLFHDSIPHNFSEGKLLLNNVGGGRYAIGDVVQQQLQANEVLRSQRLNTAGATSTAGGALINPADAQNMAQDANMVGIVNNLYTSANTVKYGLKREKSGFGFDYRFTDDIKAWTKVSNEKRTGTRRINQGTYERYNNGTTTTTDGVGNRGHLVDYFLVAGIELPETIDYRTTTFNIGTGIYKQKWLADVEYSFTNFNNKISTMSWDNPFRFEDATATGAAATLASPLSGTANAFNRGRSATGQMSLAPDSQSHDITVSASAELPLHSRITGTISYGWVTQDEDFAPYTLNSAISNILTTTTPAVTGPGFDATNPANLPQQDLNGKVATLFQSYQLTSKPIDPLTVTAKYRYYDYDNQSDNITFPGYSAFGDSFWRTAKNDVPGGGAAVHNEALSFTRQNAELAIDYRLMKPLTVMVEGFWEGWDREQLRIDGTNELGIGAGFVLKPMKSAKLKGAYRYAHRTVDGYKPGNTKENPEAVGLANYDWADRVRHKTDLRFQMMPTDALTVGLSGQYLNDKFGDDNRFGLKKNENATGTIDVSYAASDAFTMFANYAKEYRKGHMKSAAKDDAFDNPLTPDVNETTIGNFNPENYWNTDSYEKVDSFGLGATVQIIPEKLTLNSSYTYSMSRMDFNTVNPNGAVKLANAAAQAWPTVRNRLQEVKTDISYKFTQNLKAGVTYLYEWYKLDDFANTPAYVAGNSYENSTKLLLTGANNYSYDAHVTAVYLNYKF